jgi:WD40 repeat protein
MVQGTGRNNGSKGRLLAGWWKGSFGLIALLGLLMGMMMAQVKSPEQGRLLDGRDERERLFERMQGGRSPNALFRSPTGSFTSRSRQFSEELVWFKPMGLNPDSIAFSPDGQFLASPIAGGNKIGIFRVSDGSLVRTLEGHISGVTSVTFSPDGSLIASGSWDNTIKIWRVSDGSLVRTLEGHTNVVTSVTFSPAGSLIASGSWDNTIKIWRVSDGSLVRTLEGHTSGVNSVTFSPDGSLIASGSLDGTIKIWRVSDGSLVRTLEGHTSGVNSVTFSPDGSLIASGSWDRTIKIWGVSDGSLVRTLEGHTSGVNSVTFSPDGSLIASGSWDNTIKIWRVSDGSLVRTLEGTNVVTSVSFSPDGSLIASGSWDRTIKIWRVSDGSLVRTLEGTNVVTSVTFSPDGSLIASGSDDNTIKIWRVSDGSLVRTLEGTNVVTSVTFSPAGSLIASGSWDNTIKIWRVSDGSLVRTLEGHTNVVTSVTFSPAGSLIASGSWDRTIKIWGVSDGSLVRTLEGYTNGVTSVTFSPDGSLIASGSLDGTIKIWGVSDGSLVRTLTGHTDWVRSVSFSPDGSLIASGSWDNTIKIWRVSDGSLVRTLTGHTSYVNSVTFSPAGSLIASGSDDNTIKIWRVSDGSLVRTLEGTNVVTSVSFSPDGSLIASGSNDGLALWRIGAPTNRPPSAPTLFSPANNSTLTTLPIQLKLSATDPDLQRLRFKIEILQSGQVVQTFDQIKDTSGWDKASYASGETAILTISRLPSGTYQWRAYAFDGFEWSPASDVRNFTLTLQIRWTLREPIGYVVQIPIFRFKAEVPDLGSAQQIQFRIEVSPDALFQDSVIVFDSASTLGWTKQSYASGETAGFIAPYAFPLYRQLYWRVRLKMPNQSDWSEPSPVQPFQVIRGFYISEPPFLRFGRTNRFSVTVTNPSPIPTEFILSFEIKISLNTDEFSGTARLLDVNGTLVDEIAISTETSLLQFITPPLPQGIHTFHVEIQIQTTRTQSINSSRVVPILVFFGEVAVGVVVSFAVEWACKQAAKALLKETHNFNDEEANMIWEVLNGAGGGIVEQELEERAVTKLIKEELERRGRKDLAERLLRKVGTKGIPYVDVFFTVLDCIEGIREVRPTSQEIRRAWDPNMKAGVSGRDGFIQPRESLPYSVLFENIPPPPPAQPAPAQEVIITDVLDDEIDLSTFSFTGVGFGNRNFSVPLNSKTLSLDVDLRPEGKNIIVQIRGSLDEATRTVTVTFRGIDPDTGQLHPEGFLPTNQNPPEGEGWVGFEVRLKEDVQSGAQIKNKATIKFDVNPPMETNEVVVTVDREPPQSRVKEIAGSTVSFEASDDVSGVDTVALWVSEEKVNFRGTRQVIIGERQYRHHSTLSGSAEPKFSFRGKFGYNYRFYTVARDVAGNKEPEPEDSDARITIGEPPTLPKGLHMVSVPVESEDVDPKPVFLFEGNKWARWNPEARNGQGDYVLYDNDPTGFTKFVEPKGVPGRGYWVYLPEQTVVQVYGELPDETKPFVIPLKRGWSMIGNPWLRALGLNLNELRVRRNGEEKTLLQAQQAGWIEDYAWGWEQDANNPNTGRYVLVYDTSIIPGVKGQLEPWKGYWVYAHTDCELILPPPSQNKGRGTRGEGRVAKGNGWSMRLQASVNGSVGEAVMGIANGTRGLAVGLPPEPPTGNNGVQVILLKNNTPLAVDVRNDGSRRQEWEVLVRFGTRDGGRGTSERKEVVLTFDGIGYAPKDVSAWLVDTVTGKRLYLRTQPSYRFVAQEGEVERKFKVVVERGNDRPLRVVGLKATPMRGQGVVIEFSLTKPAKVEAEVLTLTGRRVAVLDAGSSEGLAHRLVWRGFGIEGQKVGSGVYLVRVRAVDEEGREVQAATVVRLR